MDENLISRIRRIYTAIGATEEADISKLRATIFKTDKVIGVCQDFRGGMSDEDLSNLVHMVIHNIANIDNHLKVWAIKNGKDKAKVNEAFNRSLDLRIIKDLSNNDKHGRLPRNGGHSRKSPQLVGINRVLQPETKPEAGSSIMMTLGRDGTPKVSGSGSAKAVISGDVIDTDGNIIGGLNKIVVEAVKALEQLLSEFDVTLPSIGSR